VRCKYSHGDNDSRPPEPPNPLRDWRLNLPGPVGHSRSIDHAKSFQTGLELAQSDYATMQDVVLGLASHGGLVRVTEVLEKQKKTKVSSRGKYLHEELIPFFGIITHPSVENSPLLENLLSISTMSPMDPMAFELLMCSCSLPRLSAETPHRWQTTRHLSKRSSMLWLKSFFATVRRISIPT